MCVCIWGGGGGGGGKGGCLRQQIGDYRVVEKLPTMIIVKGGGGRGDLLLLLSSLYYYYYYVHKVWQEKGIEQEGMMIVKVCLQNPKSGAGWVTRGV
jgi:hypothetical protein